MMVPTFRLLFWIAAVFLPFSILAAVVPSSIFLSIGAALILVVIAAADGALSFGNLSGIQVELPDLVRLSTGKEGELVLHIKNERMQSRPLRLSLGFPAEIYSRHQELITHLPKQTLYSTIQWPCKGLKQGKYNLDKCYLETRSNFGFWAIRGISSISAEIRVYPNLLVERKNLSAFFLNKGLGVHSQRQVGKGRDFEQLREYIPGDSYEDIHWKATAKRGQPITKVFQLERTRMVYVIIDASRLSARQAYSPRDTNASGQEDGLFFTTILERYVTAALVLGLAAERQGDLFGILLFDDRVRGFAGAKNGRAHFNTCRDMLYTLQPKSVSPEFSELFTFIGTRIRRRSLLLFLTNLDDPVLAQSFSKNIDIISRRHLVLVNMMRPAGAKPLFSDSPIKSVDELYQKLGGHILWQNLQQTGKVFRRLGADFSMLEDEAMCAELIAKYLSVKKRQIL
ncbi:MAG: DUF58 domain-containing protein [Thermodesulfobacteriota bacterium]|nr:DUF58 domain-containing protein [Thermodesulfobacteriota bacterium]